MNKKNRPATTQNTGGGNLPILPGQFTTATIDVTASPTPLSRPEFLRLPQAGQKCQLTGMSRSALNALVLPTAENNYKPPVRSFVLRRRGASTGIRLLDYGSLAAYIRAHEEGRRPQN
jgi:hypothetical protein